MIKMETKRNAPMGGIRIVRKHPVATFFVLAYLIGVGATTPLYFIDMPQLALIAASSSSIAGIITAALYGGKSELKGLFKSVIKFKCGATTILYALIIPSVIVAAAILINSLLGNPRPALTGDNWIMLIPTLLFFSIQAGLGEELGWRGFALPMLSRRKSVLTSSLIIGVVWTFWHTPLFFLPGMTQHFVAQEVGFLYTFVIFGLSVISSSVIFSWLYLRSGKSLIPPILMHGTANFWGWYTNYADSNAYGGFTVVYALTLLQVLVALFLALRSPYFSKRNDISDTSRNI
jgi:membrane protease YdiL (CAAX protease family)